MSFEPFFRGLLRDTFSKIDVRKMQTSLQELSCQTSNEPQKLVSTYINAKAHGHKNEGRGRTRRLYCVMPSSKYGGSHFENSSLLQNYKNAALNRDFRDHGAVENSIASFVRIQVWVKLSLKKEVWWSLFANCQILAQTILLTNMYGR